MISMEQLKKVFLLKNNMDFILSGLLLGIITSFHCVGMCGPIAIALPLHGDTKAKKLFGGILYNLGRTLTYTIMGAVFGTIGQGLGALGFQRWVSIITGSLMIATVFFPGIFKLDLGAKKKGFSLVNQVKLGLRKLFSTKTFASLFFYWTSQRTFTVWSIILSINYFNRNRTYH